MGDNRKTHAGAGFSKAVAGYSVTLLAKVTGKLLVEITWPQKFRGIWSGDRKKRPWRSLIGPFNCLPGSCLSLCPFFSLSFSMLCMLGHKVQWEVELGRDEEKNKAALLCGDVWRMGTLMCFSSFIYIHNPAWNVDYVFILSWSPPGTPGSRCCEFSFGGCTDWSRDGLVSPETSFITSDF